MTRVDTKVFVWLLDWLASRSISPAVWIGDLPIDADRLRDPEARIPWSEFAPLCARLGEIETGVPSLQHLGREVAGRVFLPPESPTAVQSQEVRALYEEQAASGLRKLFPGVTLRTAKRTARVLDIEISLQAGDADCPAFFELAAGFAECVPRVLGLKPSKIELDLSRRCGRYTVTLPGSWRRSSVATHATPAADLGRELASAGTLDEVVTLLFRMLRDELHCPAAGLWLEPPGGGELIPLRREGEPVKPPSRSFVVGASNRAFGRIDVWDPAEPLQGYEAHLEAQLPWFGIAIENLQLRERESKLRRLVEHSEPMLSEITPDGTVVQMSPRIVDILGFVPEDYIGKHVSELLVSGDRESASDVLDDLRTTERATFHRYRGLHRNGSTRWLESRIGPPVSDTGNRIVSTTDVTDEVDQQKAQLESTRKYHALIEQNAGPGALVDRKGHLLVATRELECLLDGAPGDDWVGLLVKRLHPDDRETFLEAWRSSERSAEAGRADVRIDSPDAGYRWYDISWQPQGGDGDAPTFSLSLADVTERRLAESAVQHLAEGLMGNDEPFFRSLVRQMGKALQSDIALVGTLDPDQPGWIQTRAVWMDGAPVDDFQYPIAGSPCEKVLTGQLSLYPMGVQRYFPDCDWLLQHHIESYVGIALRDASGRSIGIAASLRRSPTPDADACRSLMRVFGERAASGLIREQLVRDLHRSESHYRGLAETTGGFTMEIEPGRAVVFA